MTVIEALSKHKRSEADASGLDIVYAARAKKVQIPMCLHHFHISRESSLPKIVRLQMTLARIQTMLVHLQRTLVRLQATIIHFEMTMIPLQATECFAGTQTMYTQTEKLRTCF